MSQIKGMLLTAYAEAKGLGFPIFPPGEAQSSPVNSAPFYVTADTLRADWTWSPARARLVGNLDLLLTNLGRLGLQPQCGLIGGSFVDPTNDNPRDVDIVLFYEAQSQRNLPRLASLQRASKADLGIDCRFFPLDAGPIVSLRAASFFSLLYCKRALSYEICRAPLFLDLADLRGRPAVEADVDEAAHPSTPAPLGKPTRSNP